MKIIINIVIILNLFLFFISVWLVIDRKSMRMAGLYIMMFDFLFSAILLIIYK